MSPTVEFRYHAAGLFVCTIVGLLLALQTKRLPQRGWAALLAILATFLLFTLPETLGVGRGFRSLTSFIFFTAAPCAVLYSFASFRHAPDRRAALAALVAGGILCAIFIFFLVAGIVQFAKSFSPGFLD